LWEYYQRNHGNQEHSAEANSSTAQTDPMRAGGVYPACQDLVGDRVAAPGFPGQVLQASLLSTFNCRSKIPNLSGLLTSFGL